MTTLRTPPPLNPLILLSLPDVPQLALSEFAQAWLAAARCRRTAAHAVRPTRHCHQPAGFGHDRSVSACDGQLAVVRGLAQRGDHYRSMTPRHPAAQIFERELWEQTGLLPDGHPWLKPVRFEGERQQHMTDYPFFKVRGRKCMKSRSDRFMPV